MIPILLLPLVLLLAPSLVYAEYLGDLSANSFGPNSTANPFGAGSSFAPNGVANQFSTYGSPFSPKSATNPYVSEAPRLYDHQGNYRGKLSANPFDPDSTSRASWHSRLRPSTPSTLPR